MGASIASSTVGGNKSGIEARWIRGFMRLKETPSAGSRVVSVVFPGTRMSSTWCGVQVVCGVGGFWEQRLAEQSGIGNHLFLIFYPGNLI